MSGIHISFYLKAGRIHVFSQSLRCLGNPGRICFLIARDGQTLMMRPHKCRDFISHKVPREVYGGGRPFEVSSRRLCRVLAGIHGWDCNCSYRAPGKAAEGSKEILFFLDKADMLCV